VGQGTQIVLGNNVTVNIPAEALSRNAVSQFAS
jgi:hypothetical protein